MLLAKRIYILGYHSIKDWSYPHSIYREVFRWQMSYIKKNFATLSLSDFIEVLAGRKTLERDGVLVTFDDGVEDNLSNALPILSELAIPAVLFLSTYYVDRLHSGPRGYEFKFLSWEECRQLSESGLFTIESHTHTHPLLTKIDKNEINEELTTAKDLIKKEIGRVPVAFSYPKGQYDETSLGVVKSHHQYAFAIDGGYLSLAKFDPLIIPRILISQDVQPWKFRLMLKPYYWHFKGWRDKFRSLLSLL